ncbi:MAG: hypothetical protein WAW80_05085 [Candidatus Saccharimonadales bacterium]
MDPKRLNPVEQTAAEADYQKKFNREKSETTDSLQKLKQQETTGGDSSWRTKDNTKNDTTKKDDKSRFSFIGRRAGKVQGASAFIFIIGLIIGGVWYTSVLAPNILLVNIKEMYTNDLADATTALEIYTQIMYFNKIGPTSGQGCDDKQSVKCRLTTMSRGQKQAFEKQGFLVLGTKVEEDNRDDGDPSNDKPESRYKVLSLIPPNYKQVVDNAVASGMTSFSSLMSGNGNITDTISKSINQLLNPLGSAAGSPQKMFEGLLQQVPIASGPQLWLYSQLSTTSRAQVYGVFNPKSSFFTDARYKERIKSKYNMTKAVTVSGDTESKVNKSFDKSVQKGDGGIDSLTGQPNPTDGVSLASLSSPLNLTQIQGITNQLTSGLDQNTIKSLTGSLPVVADLEAAGNLISTTNTFSYTDLMCSWYTIGKISNNALIRAKASTAARYAMQYLKAADAIKAGTSDEVPTNVLASKLAQSALGNYEGGSATDSLIYRSITYGDLIPTSPGNLGSISNLVTDAAAIVSYNLSAYENIGTLAASWAQVIPNAAALGGITGASGSLLPPPANMNNSDRQYCLSGETLDNKTQTKGQTTNDTRCLEAINAMAPVGMQAAVAEASELGRRTCPPVNAYDDNLFKALVGDWRGPVSNTMLLTQKIVGTTLTPYISAWFGANTMAVSAATQQLYTSNIKGIPANYALFSGTGEILGDMAMSRGLMPSNVADMEAYLNLGEVIGVQKGIDDIAREDGRKNPFDPYNKFSFVGSMLRGLSPSVSERAPLLATLNNVFSVVGEGAKKLGQTPSASAFYHSQPSLLAGNDMPERMAGYLLRLSGAFCPVDIEYLQIGIMPDIMCNVRYSMPLEDIPTALNLSGVLDYMTGTHSDVYDSKVQELTERAGKADPEGNALYLQTQLTQTTTVQGKEFIDKKTGKPTPGGEYEKYLQYCVNRLDPWGRSAVYMRYDELSDKEKETRESLRDPDDNSISKDDKGSPNEKKVGGVPMMAVNATQSDLDWYTGKKCTRLTDQSQMLQYFRVYTTLCSVDGSMSGSIDCTEPDHSEGNYADPFYLNNDILYTSWY